MLIHRSAAELVAVFLDACRRVPGEMTPARAAGSLTLTGDFTPVYGVASERGERRKVLPWTLASCGEGRTRLLARLAPGRFEGS